MAQQTQLQEQVQLEMLPPDMWEHLRHMNPKSHEFGQDFAAANVLAQELGYAALTLDDVFPPQEITPPAGFSREVVLTQPVILDAAQFNGRIHSLSRENGSTLSVDVHELTTDMGNTVAYCDLRGLMTNSVKEAGPTEKGEAAALDRAILNDIKFYADQGHARKSVHGVKGVYYSRVNGTKIRGYWTALTPEEPLGMPLVGRIADCGNTVRGEEALYGRVFNKSVSL